MCLFLKSAKAIWDKIQGTYSKVGNTSNIFKLERKIERTSQGDHSVTAYYNQLETLWQELGPHSTSPVGVSRRFRDDLKNDGERSNF